MLASLMEVFNLTKVYCASVFPKATLEFCDELIIF